MATAITHVSEWPLQLSVVFGRDHYFMYIVCYVYSRGLTPQCLHIVTSIQVCLCVCMNIRTCVCSCYLPPCPPLCCVQERSLVNQEADLQSLRSALAALQAEVGTGWCMWSPSQCMLSCMWICICTQHFDGEYV